MYYDTRRKGLWLQHVHNSVQTFFFGKGSFASSFPVLSVGSLAYLRQLAALQCVPITFSPQEHAWIKDGESGILLWTTNKLYYIQRQQHSSVVLFEHKSAAEHGETYVLGRLGTLLRHMHTFPQGEHDEKLERLLFVWLYPDASFGTALGVMGTLKLQNEIAKQSTDNPYEKWSSKLFFVRINEANASRHFTVELKKATVQGEKPPSFLSNEEWRFQGNLHLHAR